MSNMKKVALFLGLTFLGSWTIAALLLLFGAEWDSQWMIPVAGVPMMTAWCLLSAPIFSYVRLRARSVIAAAVIHGSFNGTGAISLMVVKGGSDLTVGPTGLASFIVLAMVLVGLFLYDRFLAQEPIMIQT